MRQQGRGAVTRQSVAGTPQGPCTNVLHLGLLGRCADCSSKQPPMRTLRLLALIGVVVSCHLDKLFNGGGGGPPAGLNGTPVGLTFSPLPPRARAGGPVGGK